MTVTHSSESYAPATIVAKVVVQYDIGDTSATATQDALLAAATSGLAALADAIVSVQVADGASAEVQQSFVTDLTGEYTSSVSPA